MFFCHDDIANLILLMTFYSSIYYIEMDRYRSRLIHLFYQISLHSCLCIRLQVVMRSSWRWDLLPIIIQQSSLLAMILDWKGMGLQVRVLPQPSPPIVAKPIA